MNIRGQHNLNILKRDESIMNTQTKPCMKLIFICVAIILVSVPVYASPLMEATFGPDGESGVWFDSSYDVMSPVAQTSNPGINFAGGGGVNSPVAQVHEFDAAISTSATGGAGYFLTESGFSAAVGLTVTPLYTSASATQTGATYVLQHYTISNFTASTINNIWMMSYFNADLFRANSEDPAQRVGLLNDEKVTISELANSYSRNLILRQYQDDGTEIFFQGAMLRNDSITGPDSYLVAGPGTPSGGGDAVYDEIYYNGIENFNDTESFYSSGSPLEYLTEAEYAASIGFDIGSLAPSETVELVIALSTEEDVFAEQYFYDNYPASFIPEPVTILLFGMGLLGLFSRKRHTV